MSADNVSWQLRPVWSQLFIYTSHCHWEPLSWHVREAQTVASQWDRRIVQYASQTDGQGPVDSWSADHLDVWRRVGARISEHTLSKQFCIPICRILFCVFVIPHRPIFRACYLDSSNVRNVAITCKSSIHKKITESGKWSGKEEPTEIMSKNKVAQSSSRRCSSSFMGYSWIATLKV